MKIIHDPCLSQESPPMNTYDYSDNKSNAALGDQDQQSIATHNEKNRIGKYLGCPFRFFNLRNVCFSPKTDAKNQDLRKPKFSFFNFSNKPDTKTQFQPAAIPKPEHICGGKHAGLIALCEYLIGTNAQVPPFFAVYLSDVLATAELEVLPEGLDQFIQTMQTDRPEAKLMVRSSSVQEDRTDWANAGCFESVANVNPNVTSVCQALLKVAYSFYSQRSQLQLALYQEDSNTDHASTTDQHGAADGIVVQEMIGEKAGDITTITSSGVGLMPDSRSRAPGTFNLNSSWGHNEGVVQGTVVTDETLGIVLPDTQTVHARSRVMHKPERVGPIEGQEQLSFINNTHIAHQPTLTAQQIEDYAHVLLRLMDIHSQVDIEFTTQKNQNYVVQQRAQEKSPIDARPTFISRSFLEDHDKFVHPVEVISYRQYGVLTIDSSNFLIAHSLDDAFYTDYLALSDKNKQSDKSRSDIKVVFVKPNAASQDEVDTGKKSSVNPNSHAAIMFRREGVAIVEIPNMALFARLGTSDNIVLDEQRGLLLLNIRPDTDDLQPGLLRYPAPATYSVFRTSVPIFSEAAKDPCARPEALQKLLSCLQHPSPTTLSTFEALAQLKRSVAQDKLIQSEQVAPFLLPLIKAVHGALKIAKQWDRPLLSQVAQEMALDMSRLMHSIDHQQDTMNQLLYVNWIEAALTQLPSLHPAQHNVYSLRSELQAIRTERAFVSWFWSDCHTPVGESHHQNKIDPETRSWPALKSLKILHRLGYVLPTPQLKKLWLDGLANFVQQADFSDSDLKKLCYRCLAYDKAGSFEASIRDLKLEHFDKEHRVQNSSNPLPVKHLLNDAWDIDPSWQSLHALDSLLHRLEDTWFVSDKQFDQNITQLSQYESTILNCLNAMKQSRPNQVVALTSALGRALEQVDHCIKKLILTPDIKHTDRVNKFKKLVQLFSKLSMPVIAKAFAQDIQTSQRYLELHRSAADLLRTNTNIDISIMRGKRFNVSQAMISAASNKMNAGPQSLGDLHTLIHQNLLSALGKINADYNAWKCLPSASQFIHNHFPSQLSTVPQVRAMLTEEGTQAYSEPVMMAVNKTSSGYESHYAIALRSHGFRVIVKEHEKNQSLSVHVGLDGGNEYKRFNIAQALFEHSWARQLGLTEKTTNTQSWPNLEAVPPFHCGWTHRLDEPTELEGITHTMSNIVGHLIATSYRYAFGTFDKSDGLLGNYDLFIDVASDFERAHKDQNLERCAQLLDVAQHSAKELTLDRVMSVHEIATFLEDQHFHQTDSFVGLYDFYRLLQAKSSSSPLERELLDNEPAILFQIPHASFKQIDKVCQAHTEAAPSLLTFIRNNFDSISQISPARLWGKHSRLSFALEQLVRFQAIEHGDQEQQQLLLKAIEGLPWEGLQSVSDWLYHNPEASNFEQLVRMNPLVRELDPFDYKVIFNDHPHHSLNVLNMIEPLGNCTKGARSHLIEALGPKPSLKAQSIGYFIQNSPPQVWAKAGPLTKALTQIKEPINPCFKDFITLNALSITQLRPRLVRPLILAAASLRTPPSVLKSQYSAQELTAMAQGLFSR